MNNIKWQAAREAQSIRIDFPSSTDKQPEAGLTRLYRLCIVIPA